MEKYGGSGLSEGRLEEEARKRRSDPVYAMRDDTERFVRENMNVTIANNRPNDDEPPDGEYPDGHDPFDGPGDVPAQPRPRPSSGSPVQAYSLSA